MSEYVIEKSCDVVVCGSGPAGLGAAVSARKKGASVMLLEAAGLPGGIIPAVPWMPVNRLLLKDNARTYAHDTLVRHIRKYGDFAWMPGPTDKINGDGLSVHPEYAEIAIYDMLDEAGIDYVLLSPVRDVIKENGRVAGVVVREKRGLAAYHAKVVVDATGDGDVAAAAGCEFAEGREEDGIHMPITLGFSLCGIDKERFYPWWNAEHEGQYKKMADEAEERGYYIAAWIWFPHGTLPGIIGCNHGAWRKQNLKSSGLDSADLTAARRNGLFVARDIVRIFQENKVPGAENCSIDRVGALLGVRDTRRIVGEYTLSFEDTQKDQQFPDTIARKWGYIDANQVYIGPMDSGFSYPYRSLVPKKVDGLLVAGRCASASFMGHTAGKSMGNMMELGVAAGTAAALCAKSGVVPRALDVSKLRDVLIHEMGVKL